MNSDVVDSVHAAACTAEGIEGRQRLKVWHRVCKNLWNNATPEQKEAVFEKMKEDAEKESDDEEDEDTPEFFSK